MTKRAAILPAVLALACSPGATYDFAHAESALISAGPGNGPQLMVVCANANAATFPTSPNCGAATISSAADLVTALAAPALDPAQTFPVAHSFVLPPDVHCWSSAPAN